MTAEYIYGFCKFAEACGVDPIALLKAADGLQDYRARRIQEIKAMGNAVRQTGTPNGRGGFSGVLTPDQVSASRASAQRTVPVTQQPAKAPVASPTLTSVEGGSQASPAQAVPANTPQAASAPVPRAPSSPAASSGPDWASVRGMSPRDRRAWVSAERRRRLGQWARQNFKPDASGRFSGHVPPEAVSQIYDTLDQEIDDNVYNYGGQ